METEGDQAWRRLEGLWRPVEVHDIYKIKINRDQWRQRGTKVTRHVI